MLSWVRGNDDTNKDYFVLEEGGGESNWGTNSLLPISVDWQQFSESFPTDLATLDNLTLALFVHDASTTTCVEFDDLCITAD